MAILFPLFMTAMVILASWRAFQQFRDHPVAMTVCCVVAFLLMYVLF